ncbi:M1 family metallopeptidase [Taibaiella chishuiensis]|uniref:Aminopeptidase N n=1 Tax=Taibaiella chishuiensis TaxID=1434707 RepID=A0A2P8D824_9BACT|nr:M1 family metallopeptidase [Taibaiella chishuiensis]PSK93353.1 aminopeptidase N [Taibaiella chishuiensis]
MYKNRLLVLVFLLSCAACSSLRRVKNDDRVQLPEVNVSSEDQALGLYRATAARVWELVHTDIDIRFNMAERSAQALTTITLHPYYYATDSVVLDAKGMRIEAVADGKGNSLPYTYDTLQLTVKLPATYRRQDTLSLSVRYTALPYASTAGGNSAIREDRGLYFINTRGDEPYKPLQVWTQGETEANSHWFPTFDKTNFRSTFRITMHVPDTLVTLSNGRLSASKREAGGMRADTWEQEQPVPPYLAMMAISNFHVAKDSWKGKEVSYYVPQSYAPYAKDIFRHTPEMIDFYSRLLKVDYPWYKYSQVIGYDYVSGAMENVTASLFGAFNLKDKRQVDEDNNDFIVAHELFHQWFGDYVTAESWSNLTLNESFADYGEHLWSEYKYGKTARQKNWMNGLGKYLKQAAYNDPPLVRFHYRHEGEMFDRVSYSKGGLILHYLRQLTGDEAFFDALHLYLTRNALQSAEATQLRLAFEQVTGRDWNWFFNQWYYKGGHPKLSVRYSYNDKDRKVTVTATQLQSDTLGLYRLPLRLALVTEQGVKEFDWNVEQREEQFVYAYPGGQRPVVIPDAGHWLPGELEETKDAGLWQMQYQYSNDFISKWLALDACLDLKRNDTAEAVWLLALNDKEPALSTMAITARSYKGNQVIPDTWIKALGQMAASGPDSKARAAALQALGDRQDAAYTTVYELAIHEPSYKVAAAGLYALNQVNHNRAIDAVRELQKQELYPSDLLNACARVLAQDGRKEDYPFFETSIVRCLEGRRAAFLPELEDYLRHVKDEATYNKGIQLLQSLAHRDPSPTAAFNIAAALYEQSRYADKQAKIADDKTEVEDYKNRSTTAMNAWIAYKKAIDPEEKQVLQMIEELEKGKQE